MPVSDYGRDLGMGLNQLMDDAADARGENLVLGRTRRGGDRPARQSGILVRRPWRTPGPSHPGTGGAGTCFLSFARVVVPDASPALVKGRTTPGGGDAAPWRGGDALRFARWKNRLLPERKRLTGDRGHRRDAKPFERPFCAPL